MPTNHIHLANSLPAVKGNLNTIFGEILRELRTKKGFTQQQLADYSGLDRSYISELENGKLQPSLETFFRLSYELKVKPKDFIDEIDKKWKSVQ